jgi:glutaredoxin
MTVTVVLYGKKDCGICASAEDKLQRMGVPYEKRDIDYYSNPHEGWRNDESTDVMAMNCLINNHIPMIVVNGKPYDYSGAMRTIKDTMKATNG